MRDYAGLERLFVERLGLERRPVAVSLPDSAPPGVEAFTGSEPAGCGFWRLAAQGRTFHTKPADHYNCPIGSYTHNIALPPERQSELEQTIGLMASIGYLRWEEVPGIARLKRSPSVVVYAPLGNTPVDPDVVLFAGSARAVMLLAEAAMRAGVAAAQTILARPTCMAIPAAIAGGAVVSSGCIGNRVYTGIGDGDLYMMVAGGSVFRVAAEIETVTTANAKLEEYHRGRVGTLRAG